jgi:2-keto-3-deoxy-L-rhamnonate aldolase RhmA
VFVRVTDSSAHTIKPILDAGPDGIIVPQVRSAAEVQGVVDCCRYPPFGTRGYGPRIGIDYGRCNVAEYVEYANRHTLIAVMIETKEAHREIDEIVAIQGLTSVVIGPMDLSGSLNCLGETEHPRVVEIVDDVIARSRSHGVIVGMGIPADAGYASRVIRRGVQWLQLGCDFMYMTSYYDQLVKKVRHSCADARE